MIARTCAREGCGQVFTVRYESRPQKFCSLECSRVVTGAALVGARMAGAVRVREFIDGLSRLEVYETGVRMGYERAKREVDGKDLGEIGRLTHRALYGG